MISGRVTYKGEILKAGNIEFHSEGKGSYNSSIAPDGAYQVFELPVGTLTVTVETESHNPSKKAPNYGAAKGGGRAGGGGRPKMDQAKQMGAPDPKMLAERYRRIPEKYSDPKKSGLSVTLTAGPQTKDFDLTD